MKVEILQMMKTKDLIKTWKANWLFDVPWRRKMLVIFYASLQKT